jgi:hypothetical protein
MQPALRIVDETPTGKLVQETKLVLISEKTTVREVILRRVREEVERFNAQESETVFRGLVQPTDTETALNGYRLRKPRLLDADAQCALALKGFGSNGFFVLVNDRQAESLDEEIIIGPETKVSFVKLVPLVGG